jgi:hypothetical protein
MTDAPLEMVFYNYYLHFYILVKITNTYYKLEKYKYYKYGDIAKL